MTTNRDPVEPTPSEAGVPTARDIERDRAIAQNVERAQEVDVPREVEREADRGVPANVRQAADAGEHVALFESAALSEFNTRWTNIQAGFVDEPRRAVQQADALVSDVIQRITTTFSNERTQLEAQWDRGDNASTEELRQALQRYRSFFSRLLTL